MWNAGSGALRSLLIPILPFLSFLINIIIKLVTYNPFLARCWK